MKEWNRKKLTRSVNALGRAVAGCKSDRCPFRQESDPVAVGLVCRCAEDASDILLYLQTAIIKAVEPEGVKQ